MWSVLSITGFADAAGFAAARRCLRLLVEQVKVTKLLGIAVFTCTAEESRLVA